jgi:hypothetical protein
VRDGLKQAVVASQPSRRLVPVSPSHRSAVARAANQPNRARTEAHETRSVKENGHCPRRVTFPSRLQSTRRGFDVSVPSSCPAHTPYRKRVSRQELLQALSAVKLTGRSCPSVRSVRVLVLAASWAASTPSQPTTAPCDCFAAIAPGTYCDTSALSSAPKPFALVVVPAGPPLASRRAF